VSRVVAGVAALKTRRLLYQAMSTLSEAKDVAEPLMASLPENWMSQEVADVQGFGKVQFAFLAMGIATVAHSTYLLVHACSCLEKLEKLAQETKGIREEVGRLQIEYDTLQDLAAKRLSRILSLIPSLATDPAAVDRLNLLALASDNELHGFVSKIDHLLHRVVEKVVEAEQGSAIEGVNGTAVNVAQNAIYKVLAVVTPGGWFMGLAGMAVNASGGAVATTMLVIEIVNWVKCNEILNYPTQLESQLSEMKVSILQLQEKANQTKIQLAQMTGDDDLV